MHTKTMVAEFCMNCCFWMFRFRCPSLHSNDLGSRGTS